MLFIFLVVLGLSQAQRPSNASTCDYYAQTHFGANSSQTQYQLVQHIIALAFGGPPPNNTNISSDITGILNPGSFENLNVDLLSWFNGSIDSTNLNDQAVGINWLDDGGLDPLHAYLNGSTSNVTLTNGTNQYRLFSHFFQAFSHIFGCSDPPPATASPGGSSQTLSLAYVHKYMNLNYTDLGHFIDQISKATTQYGFSDQDSETLSTDLNSQYNAKCIPPVIENPAEGPQLLSLCQASNCPLAVPNADCAPYVNLTADGIASAAPSDQTVTATPTAFTPTTISPTSIASASAKSSNSAKSSSGPALSPGAIAGIAIGGAAVLIMGIVAIILALRRRRPTEVMSYQPSTSGMVSPPGEQKAFASFTSQTHSSPFSPQFSPHFSPTGQTVAEMDSTHGEHGDGWN